MSMVESILALTLAVAVGVGAFLSHGRHNSSYLWLTLVCTGTMVMLATAVVDPDRRMISLVFVMVGAATAVRIQRAIWVGQRG